MIDRRKWVKAVNASDLPQSAKRYAMWLVTRPVKGKDDEYKAGQAAAAEDLGMSVRTAHSAEDVLVQTLWMRRAQRGTKHRNYSTFVILSSGVNRKELHVETETQHELGGMLRLVGQHAKTARSMTTAPLRRERNHDSGNAPRRDSRYGENQRRSEEDVVRVWSLAASSRSVSQVLQADWRIA